MLRQKVQNRRPDAISGAGIVLLAVAAAVAGSALFTRLAPRLGRLSSVGFIAYGCAIAWLMLDRFALSFVYACNDDCLRVCRAYGKRERFMADVWLNQLQACGSLEDMKKRFPTARVARATRRQCPLAPLALAYRDGGKTAILVVQPDGALRERLLKALKRG